MEFSLKHTIEILQRTPRTLRSLLNGLSERWITGTEGPDTWSPHDVLGHLIHGEETDWIPRARIILEHGESQTFEPFDRFAFKETYGKVRLTQLLDRFESLRRENVTILQSMNLGPEQLMLCGTHPEFGRVTMAELLATWAVHDLAHIVQTARVMAKQYDRAVGPWKNYLSVLQR